MQIPKSKYHLIGITASISLCLLTIIAFCPATSDGASAAEETTSTTNTPSSISMSLQPTTEMDVVPTASGSFQTTSAQLHVSTDSSGGYTLYMHTANGQSTLVGTGTNSAKISSIEDETTQTEFPDNTWGYSLDINETSEDITYLPIPTSANDILDSTYDMGKSYQLTFAAKINLNIPSDQYSNAVVVSAVANPAQITLLDITNMQEMTSGICTNSAEGDTKRLIDTRDGQKYWVAKLKDGNCWMTQNLALDITTDGLKASDTDIARDWTATQSADPSVTTVYAPTATVTSITTVSSSYTATGSWNLSGIGENHWVLGTPLKAEDCSTTTITDISACTKVGFVKIDDTWSPTFEAKEGVFNAPDTDYTGETTYITLDYNKKEYDPHYLIGNYYYWNTATAGTGGTIEDADAEGSICPKGWELPGNNSSSTHPTFNNLLNQYGVNRKLSTTGSNAMPDIANGLYNAAGVPLYFIRSGEISYGYRKLIIGASGSLWSSTAISSTNAYFFQLNSSAAYPSVYSGRNKVISLRCVAR